MNTGRVSRVYGVWRDEDESCISLWYCLVLVPLDRNIAHCCLMCKLVEARIVLGLFLYV